ncbi:hypothetical protein [Amycolatopsis sp. CA-126428]|uniref:hypothetical protein n=1 Tax=Amycolatopsis sp. CA-126428 TaxID=2073158 RepID=UPI0011B00B83|nr:hypothetical protein [Amycolatopsis sp. CA-126428]
MRQPPGLMRLQQAAGNAAVCGLIAQRMLYQRPVGSKLKKRLVIGDTVAKDPAVVNADELVKKLIQQISSSDVVDMTYTDGDDLVSQVEAYADKVSKEIVDVADGPTLTLLCARWIQRGIDYSSVSDRIARRQEKFEKKRFTGKVVVAPRVGPVKVPLTKSRLQPASRQGREDGNFVRRKNTLAELPAATIGMPALVLAKKQKAIGNLVTVGPQGKTASVCPACGGPTDVTQFETDHQDPLSDIRDRLWRLADQMGEDHQLFRAVEKQLGGNFKHYFTVSGGGKGKKAKTVEPTKYLVAVLSNDVENLLWICRTCNGASGKSNKSLKEWFLEKELFGPEFVKTYLDTSAAESVVFRAKGGQGWGAAAAEWFETKHLSVLRKLLTLQDHQEHVKKTLIDESLLGVKAATSRRKSEQGRALAEKEQLGRQNDLTVLATGVLTTFHTRPAPEKIGANSPARTAEMVGETLVGIEKSRPQRRAQEAPEYKTGFADGYAGHPSQAATMTGPAAGNYTLGHLAGAARATGRHAAGRLDGIMDDRTVPAGQEPPYDSGFAEGRAAVESAARKGEEDGGKGADLDHGVPLDEPGAAYLMDAYMKGYNRGKSARV